jgi:hypothetical protein
VSIVYNGHRTTCTPSSLRSVLRLLRFLLKVPAWMPEGGAAHVTPKMTSSNTRMGIFFVRSVGRRFRLKYRRSDRPKCGCAFGKVPGGTTGSTKALSGGRTAECRHPAGSLRKDRGQAVHKENNISNLDSAITCRFGRSAVTALYPIK